MIEHTETKIFRLQVDQTSPSLLYHHSFEWLLFHPTQDVILATIIYYVSYYPSTQVEKALFITDLKARWIG